jgi:pilus assembly protein CpaB
MPTHSRNIVISVVLALLAGAALLLYTSSVRKQATEGTTAATVVVATRDVPAGTRISKAVSEGWLTTRTMRETDLAVGHVADAEAAGLTDKLISKDMVAGDQLSSARVGNDTPQGLTSKVSGEYRAIKIPLNENAGLLGDIVAGDRVDVYANYVVNQKIMTVLAAGDVEVIGRQLLPNASPGSMPSGSVILKVDTEQTMRIINALRNSAGGKENDSALWIVARGENATDPIDTADQIVLP